MDWRSTFFRGKLKHFFGDSFPRSRYDHHPVWQYRYARIAGLDPSVVTRLLSLDPRPRIDESEDCVALAWAIGRIAVSFSLIRRSKNRDAKKALLNLFEGNDAYLSEYLLLAKPFVKFVETAMAHDRFNFQKQVGASLYNDSMRSTFSRQGGFLLLSRQVLSRFFGWPRLHRLELFTDLRLDESGILYPASKLDKILADRLPARVRFVVSAEIRGLVGFSYCELKLVAPDGRELDAVDFFNDPVEGWSWNVGYFEDTVLPPMVGRPEVQVWVEGKRLGELQVPLEVGVRPAEGPLGGFL